MSKPEVVAVTVRCPTCKAERVIGQFEIGADDFPMCEKCGMPMLPTKAYEETCMSKPFEREAQSLAREAHCRYCWIVGGNEKRLDCDNDVEDSGELIRQALVDARRDALEDVIVEMRRMRERASEDVIEEDEWWVLRDWLRARLREEPKP